METLFNFIISHAEAAHYVIFCLLVMAGLSLPISEDLVIIGGGVLAGTIVPDNIWKIYAAIYFGAFIADILVYSTGRKLGPPLLKLKWFSKIISKDRVEWIRQHYEKHGITTLILGRFIPFGFRYPLFLTAGMGKMRLGKFLIVDLFACLFSTAAVFSLAYYFGKSEWLFSHLITKINIAIFAVFAIATFLFVWYKRKRARTEKEID